MSGEYVIEHGDVWLKPATAPRGRPTIFSRNTHVCSGSEDLAVAILDDAMIKCGSAASVEAWLEKNGGIFDITVVRFPVTPATVAELNSCVANRSRAAILIDRLTEIGSLNPSIAAMPRYPR